MLALQKFFNYIFVFKRLRIKKILYRSLKFDEEIFISACKIAKSPFVIEKEKLPDKSLVILWPISWKKLGANNFQQADSTSAATRYCKRKISSQIFSLHDYVIPRGKLSHWSLSDRPKNRSPLSNLDAHKSARWAILQCVRRATRQMFGAFSISLVWYIISLSGPSGYSRSLRYRSNIRA